MDLNRGLRSLCRIYAVSQDWARTIVAVTGGASGIGEATVRAFAGLRATVALIDCDIANGERVATGATGGTVRFFAADVSKSSEVAATVRTSNGPLDWLPC